MKLRSSGLPIDVTVEVLNFSTRPHLAHLSLISRSFNNIIRRHFYKHGPLHFLNNVSLYGTHFALQRKPTAKELQKLNISPFDLIHRANNLPPFIRFKILTVYVTLVNFNAYIKRIERSPKTFSALKQLDIYFYTLPKRPTEFLEFMFALAEVADLKGSCHTTILFRGFNCHHFEPFNCYLPGYVMRFLRFIPIRWLTVDFLQSFLTRPNYEDILCHIEGLEACQRLIVFDDTDISWERSINGNREGVENGSERLKSVFSASDDVSETFERHLRMIGQFDNSAIYNLLTMLRQCFRVSKQRCPYHIELESHTKLCGPMPPRTENATTNEELVFNFKIPYIINIHRYTKISSY